MPQKQCPWCGKLGPRYCTDRGSMHYTGDKPLAVEDHVCVSRHVDASDRMDASTWTLECKSIADIRKLRDDLAMNELHIDHQLHVHVRFVWASGEEAVFVEHDIAGMERYLRECDN